MLKDRLENPYLRYQLTGENPKEAVLYALRAFDASRYNKEELMLAITKQHPSMLSEISEREWRNAARGLIKYRIGQRGEVIYRREVQIFAELGCPASTVREFEECIYRAFLRGGNQWDKYRQKTEWSFSNEEKLAMAKEVLAGKPLNDQRRMELAQEFELPSEDSAQSHFKDLLYHRHYEEAEKLQLRDTDEIVIEVIVRNLDVGYLHDATKIVERFLPHRPDVLTEVQTIIDAVEQYNKKLQARHGKE